MIPFKCSGFDFELPSKWADLTLKQFYELRDSDGETITALSILSGVPVKSFQECEDLDILEKIYPYLSFLNDEFNLKDYFVPDFITINGKQYPKPGGIGINTAGQKWHLEDVLRQANESGKSDVDLFAVAIAIYMQPIVTGKSYDSDLVDKLVPDIMNCRLEEAWPLASFFLNNYERYLNGKQRHLHIHQQVMRYEQGLTDLRSSETFQQFSLLRRFWVKILIWLFSKITIRYTLPYGTKQRKADTKKV